MSRISLLRTGQVLLVFCALTFALAGFAAPTLEAKQAACSVAGSADNPLPPCQCVTSDDCTGICYNGCYLHGGVSFQYCHNGPSLCTGSEPGTSCGSSCTGLCECYCNGS
jgi:hypothetical protein